MICFVQTIVTANFGFLWMVLCHLLYCFCFNLHHMKKNAYLTLSAWVFLLVAIFHGLRVALNWDLTIDEWMMPVWVNLVAVLFTAYMSYTAFRLR